MISWTRHIYYHQVLEVMDNIGQGLTDKEKYLAGEHFINTSKMEYLFWDMGFSHQSWGV